MGWGKLLFAQTFREKKELVKQLQDEKKGERNLAFYIQNPQEIIHLGKGNLFLDPSLSYRLDLNAYQPPKEKSSVQLRFMVPEDIPQVNDVYAEYGMLHLDEKNTQRNQYSKALTYFVAEYKNEIVGVVIGIDHKELFNSPEGGSSAWGLVVSKKARRKGLGEKLIRHIVEHYKVKGRNYLDLSVIYTNTKAINLYEKIGFQKLPRFCVKCKNRINEGLYFD